MIINYPHKRMWNFLRNQDNMFRGIVSTISPSGGCGASVRRSWRRCRVRRRSRPGPRRSSWSAPTCHTQTGRYPDMVENMRNDVDIILYNFCAKCFFANIFSPITAPTVRIERQPSSSRLRLGSENTTLTSLSEYELPLDPDWEFPRDQLTIGATLGEVSSTS